MKKIIMKNKVCLKENKGRIKMIEPKVLRAKYIILNSDISFEEQQFDINNYECEQNFLNQVETINVENSCFMIRYVNNQMINVYGTGIYHFLKSDKVTRNEIITKEQFELADLSMEVINELWKRGYVRRDTIQANTLGILYVNGVKTKILQPGFYAFNTLNQEVRLRIMDMGVKMIAPTNQELLTKDKVGLRINFFTNYQITDIEIIANKYADTLDSILYNYVQMALRDAIADKTLDEVLAEKETICKAIYQSLKEKEGEYGVTFLNAGIKDIILPGEIRDIMNMVLMAEKKAQANVITRREEVASTRSLLNTAKLMEENQILYRLKELEMLERIFDKVGSINVSGGNMLESLELLLGKK